MAEIAGAMRRATAAFNAGNHREALVQARAVLAAHPHNVAVLQFVGVVESTSGDAVAGLATFVRALKLDPGNAAVRLNAARAGLDAGNFAAARQICLPLAGQPGGERMLADIAKAAGQFEEAILRYRTVLQASPDDVDALNNYGNALNESGRALEAVTVLERATRLAPQTPGILLGLGRARSAAGDHAGALEAFLAAAGSTSDDPEIRLEISKSLVRHGQHELALPQLGDAARLGMRTAQVFTLMGTCFSALEDRDKAEDAYRMALRVEPGSARAFLNLAIFLEQENRVDELRELAGEAERAIPPGADLDYIKALVLRRDGKFQDSLELAERSASESVDPVVRAQFIGQVADRLGHYEQAFAAFSEMNEATAHNPEARGFAGTEHSGDIASRTVLVTTDWYTRWTWPDMPDPRPTPAFLCGFLRSGTTLLDTILMGHSATEVREEEAMLPRLEDAGRSYASLPAMTAADISRMRDAYFAEAAVRSPLEPGKVLIDKYPLATLRAGYIHRAFPDARFIFALRHPCDVVLSCWMQNFRITRAMASFLTIENAARMYDAAMTHWVRCREVMPLAVHTVRYEDMVDDPESELRPLLEFLGLPWEETLLAHQQTARKRGYIRTPSYSQVTEGIYRRAKGRWENYREHFGAALEILAPWVDRWGYDPIA